MDTCIYLEGIVIYIFVTKVDSVREVAKSAKGFGITIRFLKAYRRSEVSLVLDPRTFFFDMVDTTIILKAHKGSALKRVHWPSQQTASVSIIEASFLGSVHTFLTCYPQIYAS